MRPSKRRHRRRKREDATPPPRYPEINAWKHVLPNDGDGSAGKRKMRQLSQKFANRLESPS